MRYFTHFGGTKSSKSDECLTLVSWFGLAIFQGLKHPGARRYCRAQHSLEGLRTEPRLGSEQKERLFPTSSFPSLFLPPVRACQLKINFESCSHLTDSLGASVCAQRSVCIRQRQAHLIETAAASFCRSWWIFSPLPTFLHFAYLGGN